MKAIELLIEEHIAIKGMLEVLSAAVEKMERGEMVDPNDLSSMVDFLRRYADHCHHEKEEKLLFPAMEDAGIPREGGPIGCMLSEHTVGRGCIQAMLEAIADMPDGGSEAFQKFIANAQNYINLLHQHIDKEDNILYPMAVDRLTPGQFAEMMEKFNHADDEITGRDNITTLLQLLASPENAVSVEPGEKPGINQ